MDRYDRYEFDKQLTENRDRKIYDIVTSYSIVSTNSLDEAVQAYYQAVNFAKRADEWQVKPSIVTMYKSGHLYSRYNPAQTAAYVLL